MLAGFEIPVPVIRQYIASAITLVVHLSRLKGGVRKVMNVSEMVGGRLHAIFRFKQMGVRAGVAFGEFHATGRVPRLCSRLHASGIELPEGLFEKRVLACAEIEIPEAEAVEAEAVEAEVVDAVEIMPEGSTP